MAKKTLLVQGILPNEKFSSGFSTHVDWEPRTNILACKTVLIIEMELPGVVRDDISIVLENDRELVIRGTKPKPVINEPQVAYYLFEREFGQFYKRIDIDFPLDIERIESEIQNGVLIVRIPRKPRKKVSISIE